MNCDQARAALTALVDGELDPVAASEVEAHLGQCEGCRAEHAAQRALRKALRENAAYHRAPEALRSRLRRTLRQDPAAPVARPVRWRWDWGVAFASGAAVALLGMLFQAQPGGGLEDELVSAHVRSLMAAHLSDVVSSDQHTVKPWFAGKLDFSPPVRDLAARDFPLLGGRLDYVGGRAVAALAYRHRSHLINLFVWPSADSADAQPQAGTRAGYSLVRWRHAGMSYSAVSDLNAKELSDFARLQLEPDSAASR